MGNYEDHERTKRLFQSNNLLVRHVPGNSLGHVVSFEPWHSFDTFDRLAFGEQFFRERGVSPTFVLTRGNDWYQYPELPDALAAVRGTTANARRVMTYGSSMGAYAAIRFADAVGADAALALSPQYSIDPAKAPFEMRWGPSSRTIRFADQLDGRVRSAIRPVIVYDPLNEDRLHVALYRAEIPITEVRVPHSGHPSTTFLAETGMLGDMVFALLEDRFDVRAVEQELRARRRQAPIYLSHLAAAQPACRQRTGLRLARRVVEFYPASIVAHHSLAMRLRAAGDFTGAVAEHEIAVDRNRDPGLLYDYADTLMEAGDLKSALAVSREAEAGAADNAAIKNQVAILLTAAGRHGEARATLRRLIQLDPTNRGFRRMLALTWPRQIAAFLRGPKRGVTRAR